MRNTECVVSEIKPWSLLSSLHRLDDFNRSCRRTVKVQGETLPCVLILRLRPIASATVRRSPGYSRVVPALTMPVLQWLRDGSAWCAVLTIIVIYYVVEEFSLSSD
jgi:hypothetical protein